jgi:hypothetical protein
VTGLSEYKYNFIEQALSLKKKMRSAQILRAKIQKVLVKNFMPSENIHLVTQSI